VLSAYALVAPYLAVALKRVYQQGNGVIVLKTCAVLSLTLAVNGVASSAAIRLTLALV
jgi:hypothetical protein